MSPANPDHITGCFDCGKEIPKHSSNLRCRACRFKKCGMKECTKKVNWDNTYCSKCKELVKRRGDNDGAGLALWNGTRWRSE